MIYLVPQDPASPLLSLSRLRSHARRAGYRIQKDRCAETWSLFDGRLHVPLVGLDHVSLWEIAHAIEEARNSNNNN